MEGIIALVEQFLAPIVAQEVQVLIGAAESQLPFLIKQLVALILSQSFVVEKIKELEQGGVDAVLRFLIHEAVAFGKLVIDFVRGKVAEIQAGVVPGTNPAPDAVGRVSLPAMRKIATLKSSEIDRLLGVGVGQSVTP